MLISLLSLVASLHKQINTKENLMVKVHRVFVYLVTFRLSFLKPFQFFVMKKFSLLLLIVVIAFTQLPAQEAVNTVSLTRGPYLQMGSQTAVTLRWRTDRATNSKFEAGTVYGKYSIKANNAALVTEHIIRITGLKPDTKYYYRFGSMKQI